jgi:hypothetical protein
MSKSTYFSALMGAGAFGMLVLSPVPAVAMPLSHVQSGATSSVMTSASANLLTPAQYRERRGYRSRRHYRGDRYGYKYRHAPRDRVIYRQHRVDPGATIAAGIFGMAAGALVAGALAPPPVYHYPHRVAPHRVAPRYSSADIAYCSRKYRSFDPASFTFLGYDGRRHYCRIP